MIYDLAIIGAGPAGLSASIYASRYGVKNIVVGAVSGGLVSQTHEMGNWLGTQKIKHAKIQQSVKNPDADELQNLRQLSHFYPCLTPCAYHTTNFQPDRFALQI